MKDEGQAGAEACCGRWLFSLRVNVNETTVVAIIISPSHIHSQVLAPFNVIS